ncbi:MAG: hypothetical protein QMD50_01475 [Patescibacteria group bacterium]|nr:hypothetical protein [Patescibacteria group bacterium]
MKTWLKENRKGILGIIVFFLIIFSVSIGGAYLIKNGNSETILLILCFLIFGIIWLYIEKRETKEKYKQLLRYAYKIYKKEGAKIDERDFKDYTSAEFEDCFENWLEEKREESN